MSRTLAPQSEVITVRELQQLLRIGRNKTYELLRSGEIPYCKIGRQIRIRLADVEMYLRPQR
jgi:excisionase family DNA binding protein